MKLSEKIYTCRKKAGLSQEKLAEKLGVSRQAVSKWETEEATPELMKIPAMAKLFGVTADWLLCEEEEEMPPLEEKKEAEPDSFIEMKNISASFEKKTTPKSNPYRNTWIIGVVIAVIGAGFVLFGAAALIIISILTTRTVITNDLTSDIFEEESVFPDGTIPFPWEEDMGKFFQDGSMLQDFFELPESKEPSVETSCISGETGKEA